jgi:hypothetical protein
MFRFQVTGPHEVHAMGAAHLLIGDRGDPGVVALMDLNMLAVTGGRERSLGEYDALLFAAGLRRIAVWRADSPQSVIEAVAV